MREKDIHKLIEQQDPETKQRIWERVSNQIGIADLQPQPKASTRTNKWKWLAAAAVALIVVVTLSVALPLTLGGSNDDSRFCDIDDYYEDDLGMTLSEYFSLYNHDVLYVDWYGIADELETTYGYIKGNPSDVVYFCELFCFENGERLTLWITDNKTRVDFLESYYSKTRVTEINVNDVCIELSNSKGYVYAMFEYNKHIYYLELNVDGAQERMTEIVESMFK